MRVAIQTEQGEKVVEFDREPTDADIDEVAAQFRAKKPAAAPSGRVTVTAKKGAGNPAPKRIAKGGPATSPPDPMEMVFGPTIGGMMRGDKATPPAKPQGRQTQANQIIKSDDTAPTMTERFFKKTTGVPIQPDEQRRKDAAASRIAKHLSPSTKPSQREARIAHDEKKRKDAAMPFLVKGETPPSPKIIPWSSRADRESVNKLTSEIEAFLEKFSPNHAISPYLPDMGPSVAASTLTLPFNVAAEFGTVMDPNESLGTKAGATANMAMDLFPAKIGGVVGKGVKALAETKAGQAVTRPIAGAAKKVLGRVLGEEVAGAKKLVKPPVETDKPHLAEEVTRPPHKEPVASPAHSEPSAPVKASQEASAPVKTVAPKEAAPTEPELAPASAATKKGKKQAKPAKESETVGINNSSQSADVESGRLNQPEKGQVLTKKQIHEKGKGVDIEEAHTLASDVANGRAPFSAENVAKVKEGDRLHRLNVNAKRDALDQALNSGDKELIAARQAEYDAAKTRHQDFVDNVQKGKTEWHNTGTALQDRLDLDTGDFAAVRQEARRRKGADLTPKEEAELRVLTQQFSNSHTVVTKAEMAATTKEVRSVAREARSANRQASVKAIRSRRDEIGKELAELASGGGKASANPIFEQAKGLKLLGELAHGYAKEGVIHVQDLVDKVNSQLVEWGHEKLADRHILDAFSGYRQERKASTPNEAAARVSELKKIARLTSQIDDAMRGEYHPGTRPGQPSATVAGMRKALDDVLKAQDLRKAKPQDPAVRITKSIEEALDTLEFGRKDKAPKIPDTPEVAQLRTQLDTIRKRIDAKWGDPSKAPKSEQARLNFYSKKLTEAEAQLQGKYRAVKPPKPVDPESVKAAKAKLNDVRQRMNVEDQISELERQLREGDFPEAKAKRAVSKELEELRYQRDKKRQEVLRAIESKKPKGLGHYAMQVVNAPRTVQATGDWSGALRQNLWGLSKHPGRWAQSFGKAAKAFASDQGAWKAYGQMKANTATWKKAEQAKLFIPEFGASATKGEEDFMSRFLGRVPGLGRLVQASDRHMATMGGTLRFSLFDDYLKKHPNASVEELHEYAGYLNAVTGRGEFRGKLAKYDPALSGMSAFMYSPRFALSRFQTFGYLASKNANVRKAAWADLVKASGTVLATLKLAEAAGADVNWDSDSPDFLKIRTGHTRYDITGGYLQPVRVVARIAKGITRDKGSRPDPAQVAAQYLRYKVAPGPNLALGLYTGKNAIGQSKTSGEMAHDSLTLLLYQEIRQAIEDEGGFGVKSASTAGASFLGVGTNTYGN